MRYQAAPLPDPAPLTAPGRRANSIRIGSLVAVGRVGVDIHVDVDVFGLVGDVMGAGRDRLTGFLGAAQAADAIAGACSSAVRAGRS